MIALAPLMTDYLVNALWQAPLLFCAGWLMCCVLRRMGPAAEHRVWVAVLFAQVSLPLCALPRVQTTLLHLLRPETVGKSTVTIELGLMKPHEYGASATLLHAALLVYAGVTTMLLLRIVWSCMRLRQLRSAAVPLHLQDEAALFVERCCRSLGVRGIALATATEVRTPLTFGLVRPLLIVPPGFADEVTTLQMRTVLGHELAHVARRDSTKQLMYQLLSLPVAFHPAAWLTLAHLAETRERVCDRIAAELIGDTRQYARTLLELSFLLTARQPAHHHAIGLFDANQLERRILMLNRKGLPVTRSLRFALIAGSTLMACMVCTSAAALHVSVTPRALGGTALQMRVPSGVMAGQVVNKVPPHYPEEAKRAKIQGSVVLSAIIDRNGAVQSLQVVSGPAELQASALDAVRQWVYKPYLLNGEPVEVETTVTINYSFGQ